MAKKSAAKESKATKKSTKKAAAEIVLDPCQDKALRLVDKSAKVRGELEQAVTEAASKVVRKVMKAHDINLTPAQADMLTTIWFAD
jgi:hypothetical protein